jgi:hypothetical protein
MSVPRKRESGFFMDYYFDILDLFSA